MNCLRVREELKAYIDGELGLVMRWRIIRHLARCAACREEVQIMTELTNGVQSVSSVSAPDDLKAKVLGRLQFEPAVQGVRRWPYKTRPLEAVFILLIVIVMAAVVVPVMNRTRGSSDMARKSTNMSREVPKEQMQSAKPIAPGALPSMPAMRMKSQLSVPEKKYMAGQRVVASATPDRREASVQMIAKSADLGVQVVSFRKASDAATRIAREEGGYVTDSSASSESGSLSEGTFTLRVPSDRFEHTIERLSALGKVKTRNLAGDDVTGEVVDLESRLRNKRSEERQYLQIMNGAKRIPDIVTVTNELSRVRGEIEESQGRLKYLRSSANMSTINLTLSEKSKPKHAQQSGLINTFHDALASLAATGSALASLMIWLAVYSPFWGLPLLALIYMKKRAVPVH